MTATRDDALAELDEHIAFASRLIGSATLADGADELRALLRDIERRRADKHLYLAVVGEFSSGKSTFINALLREPLLRTSALPSTGVATELRPGATRRLSARFQGDASWVAGERLRRRVASAGVRPAPMSQRDLVRLLTADERVTPHVERVRIVRSAPLLDDGVVLLDTPGINAELGYHAEIATRVIEQEADAFVVVIPSLSPVSMTLMELLTGPLHPHLDRCVFVVTKMADVDAEEQESLRAMVARRLADDLGVADTVVWACSVGVVMRHLEDPAGVPPQQLGWIERFGALEDALRARLHEERTAALSAGLARLLTKLMDQSRDRLQHQRRALREDRKRIDRERLPTLKAFLAREDGRARAAVTAAFDGAATRLDEAISVREASTCAGLGKLVLEASSRAELQVFVETTAPRSVERELAELAQRLELESQRAAGVAQRELRTLDARFEAEYRRLKRLGRTEPGGVEPAGLSPIALDPGATLRLAGDERGRPGVGMALGIALGTLVAGPLGLLVGGGLGGALGGMLGPSFATRRQRTWNELEPRVRAAFAQFTRGAREALWRVEQDATAQVERHCAAYTASYRGTVAAMTAEQSKAARFVKDLERRHREQLTELDAHRVQLAALGASER